MDPRQIEQLHSPDLYPDPDAGVEIIQTHLSVVCLAGDRVYKFKKAIRLDFVDYSDLSSRKHFCEEEVRLNRRLCPDVYRGVAVLFRTANGELRLRPDAPANATILDYAVEMIRLPENRMLDRLLEKEDAVSEDEIREIAVRVAAFHRDSDRSAAIDEAGAPAKLRRFAIANFEETRSLAGELFHPGLHDRLADRTRSDFDRILPVLERRAATGHIIDGHGDLHSRNICLTDPVSIYDCIEFNPEFRCSDAAAENAFLVMDLRFRGHPELASAYLDTYIGVSGDREQSDLMPALVRYRAMVRAKVSAIAASEGELGSEEQCDAREDARRYFHFAAVSAVEEDGPWLIISCGLPGSGKSFAFRTLGETAGWTVFSSDRIRKELAGVKAHQPLDEAFYSDAFSRKTYREMIDRGVRDARAGGVALLDANFRTRAMRTLAGESAAAAGLRLAVIGVDTPADIALDRLAHADDLSESDAAPAIYRKLRAEFEPPTDGEADRLLSIEGTSPPDAFVPEILGNLLR